MNTANHTKWKKIFEIVIQFLIIISIIVVSIETLPDLSSTTKFVLNILEIILVSIFTVEYFTRIYMAKNKLNYIFGFYGIIDLISIIPFYLSLGIDGRPIRVIRVLRFVRIMKLAAHNRTVERFIRAFTIVKEDIGLFTVATAIVLYLSSVGIYYFENAAQPELFKSVFHSLWWSVVTLTTVGYGDIYPITLGGKIFASIVLISGLGIITIPAGLLASAFQQARKEEENKDR